MTIGELEDRHIYIQKAELDEVGWRDVAHLKLSIEFAISVLEEIIKDTDWSTPAMESKIQELKQYLDEANKN